MNKSETMIDVSEESTDFVMSPEVQEMYEAWQDQMLQDSYEEQKEEWIKERGEDSLEKFEEEFRHFVVMLYQDDPD